MNLLHKRVINPTGRAGSRTPTGISNRKETNTRTRPHTFFPVPERGPILKIPIRNKLPSTESRNNSRRENKSTLLHIMCMCKCRRIDHVFVCHRARVGRNEFPTGLRRPPVLGCGNCDSARHDLFRAARLSNA